ncbi:Hypothetical predicted protein [Olea europaea subsp. europaea]|uniref:Choline transporter-like protein n=1 Tax=Olea europaea subsp. europaea TaxID=158383 RepID=A0A8S0UXR6_OLEEU|nr:Hypothetical predicted protein [Olea europaea subsp. europaea]
MWMAKLKISGHFMLSLAELENFWGELALWSFGVAGVVALNIGDAVYCLLMALSVSLFWTGAVICDVVHVVVSGMVFLVLIHGGREVSTIPPKSLMNSLRYAITTSFGSICYGSLFTAAIRTLRWERSDDGIYSHVNGDDLGKHIHDIAIVQDPF